MKDQCCNGNCERAGCPRYRDQPSPRSWLWADRAVLAIALGCVVAAFLSAIGAIQ